MADEFNNQNNGNNQNYAQSANNDMQVQMAVDNAMAEQKKKKKKIEHLPDRVLRFSDVRCQDFVVSLSFVGLFYRRCRTWNR